MKQAYSIHKNQETLFLSFRLQMPSIGNMYLNTNIHRENINYDSIADYFPHFKSPNLSFLLPKQSVGVYLENVYSIMGKPDFSAGGIGLTG